MFSLNMLLRIMAQEKRVKPVEIRFLCVGGTKIESDEPNPVGEGGWLTNKMWCVIEEATAELEEFRGWSEEFKQHLDEWKEIALKEKPYEVEEWPGEIAKKLTLFQKIIVCNILTPDKIIPGISYLITHEYGE